MLYYVTLNDEMSLTRHHHVRSFITCAPVCMCQKETLNKNTCNNDFTRKYTEQRQYASPNWQRACTSQQLLKSMRENRGRYSDMEHIHDTKELVFTIAITACSLVKCLSFDQYFLCLKGQDRSHTAYKSIRLNQCNKLAKQASCFKV